jgi:hypothetical protein
MTKGNYISARVRHCSLSLGESIEIASSPRFIGTPRNDRKGKVLRNGGPLWEFAIGITSFWF